MAHTRDRLSLTRVSDIDKGVQQGLMFLTILGHLCIGPMSSVSCEKAGLKGEDVRRNECEPSRFPIGQRS